jgi:hypothetical protein
MQLSPFMPIGAPFALTTNATPSTSQSATVTYASLGITGKGPSSVRLLNKGTADIWVSITQEAMAEIIPVAGTTGPGTPANAGSVWLEPGVDLVFTIAAVSGPTTSAKLCINSISASASQEFYVQFGEGA